MTGGANRKVDGHDVMFWHKIARANEAEVERLTKELREIAGAHSMTGEVERIRGLIRYVKGEGGHNNWRAAEGALNELGRELAGTQKALAFTITRAVMAETRIIRARQRGVDIT